MAAKITKLSGVPTSWAILAISLSSMCFSNSYDGRFVFDDSVAIVQNNDVKGAPLSNIFVNDFWGTKLSHKSSHRSYRPLTVLTFRFQYWLRGDLNPMDFHLFNIILNVAVCNLTLFIFRILLDGKSNDTALYGALLFAVHPCHTEAVSGIVGRAEILCAFFVWLSIISYNHWIFSKSIYTKFYCMTLSIACISVAILCKETGITAIGICGIYDVIIVNKLQLFVILDILRLRITGSDVKNFLVAKFEMIKRLAILALTAAVLILLRFRVMGFSMPTFQTVDNPASYIDNIVFRFINYNYIYCLNIWLLICPEWLCFDWSMGCVPLIEGYDRRIIAVLGFWMAMGLFISCILNSRNNENSRHLFMALALLIVPFLPASNILFRVGFVLAERTLYLPSAGYCLLVAIGLKKLIRVTKFEKLSICFYGALIALFFGRSWMRSDQWRNEKTLFRSALGVCSLNAKVHYNIAANAADSGDVKLAEAEYREALRLAADYPQALNNLGNLMKDQGNFVEAEKLLKRAVELKDDFAAAWMNLGIVLSALRKFNESEDSFKTSLSHRSRCPDCYYNLGISYLDAKEYDKALEAWKRAIEQKVDHRRAWVNRIRLLDDMGKPNDALNVAQEALKFISGDATVHLNVGNILGKAGLFEEAEVQFKLALAIEPTNSLLLSNLGVLYHRWNKFDEADVMYKKALAISPNLRSARENSHKLLAQRQKLKKKKSSLNKE